MIKKILKRTLTVVLGLILILILALALHPFWLGSAVSCGAEKIGPKFTGTPIEMASCDINLYAGRVAFDGFALGNPEGTSEKNAASVGAFKVVVDPTTVASDVIVIKEITIKDVFASYLKVEGKDKMNFDVIAENAAGGEQATVESEPTVEGEPTEEPTAEEPAVEEPAVAEKPAKKVIIEKLSISGVKVNMMGFPIVVPVDINLTDIGKEKGGATFEEAFDQICEAIMKAVGALGDGLKALGGIGLDLGQQGLELGQQGLELGADAVDAAGEGLKNAAETTTEALKDVTEGATDLIKGAGESIKDLGSGLKSLF